MIAHQIKVHADNKFQKARIRSIDASELIATLEKGTVTVVAGFQGVDHKGNLVTLGRGGSDTTKVQILKPNADLRAKGHRTLMEPCKAQPLDGKD